MVKAPTPHAAEAPAFTELGKKSPGPIEVAAVWSRTDKGEVDAVTGHPRGKTAIFAGILFRREVAPAAPRLVADTPKSHFRRPAIAVGRANLGERRGTSR